MYNSYDHTFTRKRQEVQNLDTKAGRRKTSAERVDVCTEHLAQYLQLGDSDAESRGCTGRSGHRFPSFSSECDMLFSLDRDLVSGEPAHTDAYYSLTFSTVQPLLTRNYKGQFVQHH